MVQPGLRIWGAYKTTNIRFVFCLPAMTARRTSLLPIILIALSSASLASTIERMNNKRRQIALPPLLQIRKNNYFRLVIAVRSTESLAMPAAPHQFEPTPVGLIGVTLVVPEALKALVKALQLPFDRSVSE